MKSDPSDLRFSDELSWQALGSFSSVFLRFALGLSFLSAVADRFGLWGLLASRMCRGEISPGSSSTRAGSIGSCQSRSFLP